ncbi:hypothetical protein MBLNU230_g2634t1 [Neophaeotheca triangularis]
MPPKSGQRAKQPKGPRPGGQPSKPSAAGSQRKQDFEKNNPSGRGHPPMPPPHSLAPPPTRNARRQQPHPGGYGGVDARPPFNQPNGPGLPASNPMVRPSTVINKTFNLHQNQHQFNKTEYNPHIGQKVSQVTKQHSQNIWNPHMGRQPAAEFKGGIGAKPGHGQPDPMGGPAPGCASIRMPQVGRQPAPGPRGGLVAKPSDSQRNTMGGATPGAHDPAAKSPVTINKTYNIHQNQSQHNNVAYAPHIGHNVSQVSQQRNEQNWTPQAQQKPAPLGPPDVHNAPFTKPNAPGQDQNAAQGVGGPNRPLGPLGPAHAEGTLAKGGMQHKPAPPAPKVLPQPSITFNNTKNYHQTQYRENHNNYAPQRSRPGSQAPQQAAPPHDNLAPQQQAHDDQGPYHQPEREYPPQQPDEVNTPPQWQDQPGHRYQLPSPETGDWDQGQDDSRQQYVDDDDDDRNYYSDEEDDRLRDRYAQDRFEYEQERRGLWDGYR